MRGQVPGAAVSGQGVSEVIRTLEGLDQGPVLGAWVHFVRADSAVVPKGNEAGVPKSHIPGYEFVTGNCLQQDTL